MAFASIEIGGVKIVVRQDLRIDYSRPSAHSDSYLSSYFYDGYVILSSEQKLEPLTLAAFGEAQNQAQALREQQKTEQRRIRKAAKSTAARQRIATCGRC